MIFQRCLENIKRIWYENEAGMRCHLIVVFLEISVHNPVEILYNYFVRIILIFSPVGDVTVFSTVVSFLWLYVVPVIRVLGGFFYRDVFAQRSSLQKQNKIIVGSDPHYAHEFIPEQKRVIT